jgi:1,4-dihydroxy-2-naphthoate octaprenyltransferase
MIHPNFLYSSKELLLKQTALDKWIRLFRLPFLTASSIPFFIGTAYAYYQYQVLHFVQIVLGFLSLTALHLAANVLNDYYDYKSGNDAANKNWSPFNGGSRLIQDGSILPKHVLRIGLLCLGIGIITGFLLFSLVDHYFILIVGGLGILCGIGYTMPPSKWGYRGIGESVIGLAFGPLIVIGACFIQTQKLDFGSLFAGIPIGLLITVVLLVNEIPDAQADRTVGKKTWVVLFREKRAVQIVNVGIAGAYLFAAVGVICRLFPVYTLSVFLTLPLFFLASHQLKNYLKGSPYSYQANRMTIQLHSLFGLLFALSLFLPALFR